MYTQILNKIVSALNLAHILLNTIYKQACVLFHLTN